MFSIRVELVNISNSQINPAVLIIASSSIFSTVFLFLQIFYLWGTWKIQYI